MSMASVETPKSPIPTRRIYVRPEHEPAWQKAVRMAKTRGVSLSEVVSLAVGQYVDTTDANA